MHLDVSSGGYRPRAAMLHEQSLLCTDVVASSERVRVALGTWTSRFPSGLFVLRLVNKVPNFPWDFFDARLIL